MCAVRTRAGAITCVDSTGAASRDASRWARWFPFDAQCSSSSTALHFLRASMTSSTTEPRSLVRLVEKMATGRWLIAGSFRARLSSRASEVSVVEE